MTEAPRRSLPRRILNRFEVDQAVFFAVAIRGWQLLTGPALLALIAVRMTLPQQGYHFTFGNLLALQSFVELGLRVVLLNLASHEWSRLRLDDSGRIEGDPDARSRLASLARLATRWYAVATLLFAMGVAIAGRAFFTANGDDGVRWEAPWFALVGVASLQIAALPLLTLLDACQQMPIVNRYRFAQAVTATLAGGVCLLLGGSLWTAVAIAGARLAWDVYIVALRYRAFFGSLFRTSDGPTMSWRDEVLPMQWRLAIQAVVAWFAFSLFNPVIFRYHGPAEAGRMGMTWAALTALQAAAAAWVETRAPLFGMLVARRDWRELDRVFFRVATVSLQMLLLGSLIACAAVWGLGAVSPRFAGRILPMPPTVLLSIGLFAYSITQFLTIYLRAHKRDPLLVPALVSQALVGLAVWTLGARWGAIGAAAGYMAVHVLFTLPCWLWTWHRCRREWHREEGLRAC